MSNTRFWEETPVLRIEDQKVFSSLVAVAEKMGCKPESIRKAICERRRSMGYHWKYYCAPIKGEKWKKIEGSQYKVSNFGRIINCKTGRCLKPKVERNGYCRVEIVRDGVKRWPLVHRLVVEAFTPNLDNKPQVNHKNGDKTDNRVDNLEYVTAKENIAHACKTGLRTPKKGLAVICIETGEKYSSLAEAARMKGYRPGNLCHHLKGEQKHKTFAGLHWSYEKKGDRC